MKAIAFVALLAAAVPAQVIGTGYGAVGLPIQLYGNASIGGVVNTVVWYQPGGSIGALCYLSLGGAGSALPEWHGDILIDPLQIVVAGVMTSPAAPGVEWTCPVGIPNNPVFAGLIVYAQCVVSDANGGLWLSLGSYFMVQP